MDRDRMGGLNENIRFADPLQNGEPRTGGTQTWPVRTFWFGVNRSSQQYQQDFAADITQLASYISKAEARNFYGRGHGGDSAALENTTFFNLNPRVIKWRPHRYRFAFLDGCVTGTSQALLGLFGIDPDEFTSGTLLKNLSSSVGGPMQLSSYPSSGRNKRRPALFLGYQTLTIVGIYYDPINKSPDPASGCEAHSYDALANWHDVLAGFWQIDSYDFITAAKQASEQTMGSSAQSPFPNRNFQDDYERSAVPTATRPIYFTPDDCLLVFGYGKLKLRDFNSGNSSW
jgi:hypothetical protein